MKTLLVTLVLALYAAPQWVTLYDRTEGLQTNPAELSRAVLNQSIRSNAEAALSRTLAPGHRSGENRECGEYDLTDAAADVMAMAIVGHHEEARTRLLEFTAITLDDRQSGANQCALDAPTAVRGITEAAWLLESYSGWSTADRSALANWLTTEVFPLADWAATHRKNNWGAAGLAGAYEIAAYASGGVETLTRADGSSISPQSYLEDTSGADLTAWLSTETALDSACGDVFGQQPNGSFPDELRRTGGVCDQPDLSFANGGSAVFYSQKSTNLLARLCESRRRVEGNGASCFDLVDHGGSNTRLVDALWFSTGFDPLDDNAQGVRHVLGQYMQDRCILEIPSDGQVFSRGGRDMPYASITHADGVAYESTPGPC